MLDPGPPRTLRRTVYNLVDEPAPMREWPPLLARAPGARPPRHFPAWLARLVAGEAVGVTATEARGASNAKAKRELGWTPRYRTWRTGFPAVYSARPAADARARRSLGLEGR